MRDAFATRLPCPGRLHGAARAACIPCLRAWLLLALWLAPAGALLRAQEPSPDRVAFDAALRALDGRFFQRAADEFAAFAEKFPGSALLSAAAEQSRLARGEAALAAGQWKPASETFAAFLRD